MRTSSHCAALWATLSSDMAPVHCLLRIASRPGWSHRRMRQRKLVPPRTARGRGEHHAMHADPHQGADLQ